MVKTRRSPYLDDVSALHYRNAIGHRQRFFLIMRYVKDGCSHLSLDALDFELHGFTQFLVKRAEGLVHQHNGRLKRKRSCDRHTLLLATRQFRRKPVSKTG